MQIYLAGVLICIDKISKDGKVAYPLNKTNVLESFFYLKDSPNIRKYIKQCGNLLIDSGAFTFMNSKKTDAIDWDAYVEDYAKFINDYDIKYFFELDIDSIVGIKEVERLREKLERLTKKKCIPVWHKSRGHEYRLKMIKNYEYVAIGGVAIKDIKPKQFIIFKQLLREAHKENCKVHGLGFTRTAILKDYKFDSVDSTARVSGNKRGYLYKFNGKKMIQIKGGENQRLSNPRKVSMHNFLEWMKYSKYAENYL